MPAVIPLIIMAASSVAAAEISKSGAQNAAKTQATAAQQAATLQQQTTDKSLGVMGQMYQQGQAGLQPYQQSGTAAGSRLSYLMGIPQTSTTAPTAAQSATTSTGGLMQPGQAVTPKMSDPGLVPAPQTSTAPQTQTGGMVTIQAPTGEMKQVPQEQAQFYVSKGAKVVSGNGQSPYNPLAQQR